MNYFEWSKEYEMTAEKLDEVIERLKKERLKARTADKLEISDKIAMYKRLKNECLGTAAHLMDRHRGVA